jgi:ferritin-like metal-binding protein YciE
MAIDLHDQLTNYLTDAHSIEEQALAQLRTAPDIAGDEELARNYREHLRETEGHEGEVRRLLEARDAKPSRVKDTVMAVGGKGFLLFARLQPDTPGKLHAHALQPDTPGKLHAHALSYEALELSSYELLGGVAEAADELEVVEAAERIAAEEREMMQRLEATFDRAVDASLREVGRDDLQEQLRKYLADAHAIEEQAEALLERGPKLAGDPTLADIYERHLKETRKHSRAVEKRLQALGGDSSSLKDAAMRLGALNWGAFFQGHPDTPGKLAAFARAFEYLEIGGYEQLKRVADRAGDAETVRMADGILADERRASELIAGAFDRAVQASLREVDVVSP